MNWYYWIQENKTKWYGTLGVIGLLILIFVKNSFWIGASYALLTGSIVYFIWFGFQKIRNSNKEE